MKKISRNTMWPREALGASLLTISYFSCRHTCNHASAKQQQQKKEQKETTITTFFFLKSLSICCL